MKIENKIAKRNNSANRAKRQRQKTESNIEQMMQFNKNNF